ncbi:MAG: hypothetical protein Q7S79_01825 [bacterium]|nr:hypothetical protein [bacterium]
MAIELALPVANWQNKTSGERTQDLSSAALELQRKANIYWTTPEQLVRLTDTNRTDHSIYRSETTATIEMVEWAAFSGAECLVLISGEKKGFYQSTRVVLSKKYEDGGRGVRILNIAVCLPIAPEECVELYEEFAGAFTDAVSAEDFRDRPVEFNLPEGKSFDDLVRSLTGKTISALMDEKLVATKDAREIVQGYAEKIGRASTLYEQILVGARIEQELIDRGYQINQFRDCPGVSNTEALQELLNPNFMLASIGYDTSPRDYKFDKEGLCTVCGLHKRDLGPCDMCEFCDRSGAYKKGLALAA